MSSPTWQIFSLGLQRFPIGRFGHVGSDLLNVTEISITDLQQAMLQEPSRRSQNLRESKCFSIWWFFICFNLIIFDPFLVGSLKNPHKIGLALRRDPIHRTQIPTRLPPNPMSPKMRPRSMYHRHGSEPPMQALLGSPWVSYPPKNIL